MKKERRTAENRTGEREREREEGVEEGEKKKEGQRESIELIYCIRSCDFSQVSPDDFHPLPLLFWLKGIIRAFSSSPFRRRVF